MTLGTVADLSPAARYQRRNVLLVEEDTAGETGNQRGRGWDSRGECFVDSVLSFCHHVSVLLLSTKIGGEGRGGGERRLARIVHRLYPHPSLHRCRDP